MMPRLNRVRSALPLILIGIAALNAACGGGDAVEPLPEPPSNRAPAAAAAIPDQTVVEGQTVSVDIAGAFTDPDGDALTYAASSSNADVAAAAVSGSELSVTGVVPGAAAVTLTATDPGGLSASQSFAAEVMAVTATRLTITPGSMAFTAIGQTVQLSADVLDQLGRPISDASVAWSSGDDAIATVDAAGGVTAAGNGETAITATSGAAADTARIFVRQTVHSMTVTPTSGTLTALGDTLRLVAVVRDPNGNAVVNAAVTWSSDDTSVVTVDPDGLATAAGNGEATVTAKSGAVSGSARLTVDRTAASVDVSPSVDTLTALGDTLRLAAVVRDANGHAVGDADVTWSSSDASVVTVDPDGLVTAVADGRADVTAVAGDVSGEASVAVSQRAAAVDVSPATATLAPADTVRLTATAADANGHAVDDAAFTWTSSDTAVASVDDMGLVEAVAEGTAMIAAAAGDAQDTARITVESPRPPPDLGGTYTLESIAGTATGGVELTQPAVSGALELTQDAPSGASATGRYDVTVTTPAATIAGRGTYTVDADGSWEQTGQVSGEGSYAVSGDSLTIVITEPATAASTTVWVKGTSPPTPGMWRGLVVAPERRCSEYDPDDYRHPDSLRETVVTAMNERVYSPYTGVYYDDIRDVDVDHIVAKAEAHVSGGCAWSPGARRVFARDVANLTLAPPRLDRFLKAGSDAAEWLPDFNQCWYAGAVVAVRRKYELTVDEAERDALEEVLADCESTEMVFTAESWTVEAITLGDESGWQALSPNEPDFEGRGEVSHMAVFCTSTFASVDFAFVTGGARLDESEENYETGRLRYTSRVNIEWSTPPPRALEWISVTQYPHWDTWTARIGRAPRDAFIEGLVLDRQRVFVPWLLHEDKATIIYEGDTDAREKILDILRRCTGGDGDLTTLLSGLARDPTAVRGRP